MTGLQRLIKGLKDPRPACRRECARALGQIGLAAKDAVPALKRALQDREWDVREASARALGKIRPADEEVVLALIEALEDPKADVRWTSAKALGNSGPAAVPAFVAGLKTKDWCIRIGCARALVFMGQRAKGAEQALVVAALDRNSFVRETAEQVLRAIRG